MKEPQEVKDKNRKISLLIEQIKYLIFKQKAK